VGKYGNRPAYGLHGYRSGWRSIRNRHIKKDNDFCTLCGIRYQHRLSVHHIEPYRVSKNNSCENLVTVCSKCHPKLEKLSVIIADLPESKRRATSLMVASALEDLWHLYQGRHLLSEKCS